ncbi:class I tRNA ligase family protein, partial [Peribacillus sp. NPDC056705]|uniref:class I tRNA ligase family protein n=1 Tax=Peribacillus sp. NPDC056705 TaxID=3345918 RepID=UPI003748F123
DNIPFHTLIWPALLRGVGGLHLPDRIISCEYMTLEGKKFSTSRNWAVWVPDLLSRYQPDSIRYFLIANGPEKRDTDFSWREFIHSHNGELLGAFGNLVNRTLVFVNKSFDAVIPAGRVTAEWQSRIEKLYSEAGALIEEGRLKEAVELIFSVVRLANKYFDERKPWLQVKESRDDCGDTLFTCVQIIANLANLLQPFTPFACDKIREFLSLQQPAWTWCDVSAGTPVRDLTLLFERIDPSRIEEETRRLEASH